MKTSIEFNGRIYTRYNGESYVNNRTHRYFMCTYGKKTHLLHVDIYEDTYGKVRKGYVIHHLDENTLNNNIDNLVKLTIGDHSKLHNKGKQYNLGHTKSKEANRKYVESRRGNLPILQCNLNGKVIRRFKSTSEACKELKLYNANINNCLRGDWRTYKGFTWCYA